MIRPPRMLGAAVVGAGYWGPNLVRNFLANERTDLRWLCDLDLERARKVAGYAPQVRVTSDLAEILADDDVHVVAVATPAFTHFEVVRQVLESGRHVLVEKPLATSVREGEALVDLAERSGLVLMCDHTYCYTPAVIRLRELVLGGALGEIQYIHSTRINLGLVQPDIDVFWDLAPHDLSILDAILPADRRPLAVSAQGADPLATGRSCIGYLTLPLQGGGIAHTHVNWLSPAKIRTMIVGGSRRMVVWDDMNPAQRLSVYDKGVDVDMATNEEARRTALVSYRVGDMVAPALPEREALQGVVNELVDSISAARQPHTDGHAGLRVLRILEAADSSLRHQGSTVSLTARALAEVS